MPCVDDGLYEARAFYTSAMAGIASVLTPRNSELIFIVFFGLHIICSNRVSLRLFFFII